MLTAMDHERPLGWAHWRMSLSIAFASLLIGTAAFAQSLAPLAMRSSRRRGLPAIAAFISAVYLLLWATSAGAGVDLGDGGKVTLSGDFRARLEQDFDSQRADGRERDDRLRLRARVRLGITWRATESLTVGARLRSGSDESHQSPHVTVVDFDDNDTGDADFNLDKWYLQAKKDDRWAWVGRNSFPFWKANEFFWDDDVTPAGVAGGFRRVLGESGDNRSLDFRLGYLTLPVGMQEFSGNLGGAQLVFANKGFTLAAGLFDIDAASSDPDATVLRNGNGLRDYRIWVVNVQAKRRAGGRPLALGVDFMHNDQSYGSSDPFGFANRDETDAYVASIVLGQTKARGDWLAGLYYAHIEALAVAASYAQDDWIRWGSAIEADSSDLEGFELRYARSLGQGQNLVVRLYLVEAITSRQDGNRFRLDYNLKF
ncbi:MAG: putative porin [Thermoanaerobaculia bacterium]